MAGTTLLLTDLYLPISEDLTVVERLFDEELRSDFGFVNELCDGVRSYRGKMLRPALTLLTARAIGKLTDAHRTLAAVVEMVHMATLVHDDVLDEADERRGQPPPNAIAGNVAAVLLGDYLISHAFHLCSSLQSQHASRRIGATTNIVCQGELLQSQHRGNADLPEHIYLDIVGRKTGVLTAVACELGAHQAGADRTVVEAMRSYGMSAGIAFQIIDDVLDIVGDRGSVGKTLGLDLLMGKATLPTIHCLRNASDTTAAALRKVVGRAASVDGERLRAWLGETDSINYAVSCAKKHVADAIHNLGLLPHSDARASLTALAEFIVNRQF
ncbi:MAG: polyprenyl synthetase family protein [Phycisphaerales bacterium]|nr:MAG: polyprenyl synthetase family protein [Phycisphaerales bacterium]